MNGKVPVVKFSRDYPKDGDGHELFTDLNEKGRWWYKVPVTIAFKRMRECGGFVPKIGTVAHLFPREPAGWGYYSNFIPMKSWGDKKRSSWDAKYRLLEALAQYQPPSTAIEDLNFAESVEEYGEEFWTGCGTPEELADYYAMGLESSAKWHAVARKVCNERGWGAQYLRSVNEIRRRRRLDPLFVLPT